MSLGRSSLPFVCGDNSFRRISTSKVILAGRWLMLFLSLLFELEVLINSHIVWIRQSCQDPRLLIMWQTCCCARRLKPKNVSILLMMSRIFVVYSSSWWCEVISRSLAKILVNLDEPRNLPAFSNHAKKRLRFWISKVSLAAWCIFLVQVTLLPKCASLWCRGNPTPRYLCHFDFYSSMEQLPTKFETPQFPALP